MQLFSILKLCGGIVMAAGDVWVLWGWITEAGLFGLRLGPPEYAALTFIFTCGFVAFNWNLIQSRRPGKRFHAMHEDLEALYNSMSDGFENEGEDWMAVRAVMERFDRLKIKYPELQWPVTEQIKKTGMAS